MSERAELDSESLSSRVVAAGVVELSVRGETPAHAGEIRRACNDAMEAVESDVLGTVSEAEVSRTLNELEADGVVEGARDTTSATGKGRPSYRLVPPADAIHAALADDDRTTGLAERIDSLDS
jgi:predicted ArsR family transcriptional regulator